MRIGIDIDDTLTNSRDFFIQHVSEYMYKKGYPIKTHPEYLRIQNFFELNNTEIMDDIHEAYITSCPVRYFAKEAIKLMKEQGHEIYIITARWANQFIDEKLTTTCAEATKKWLMDNEILFDKLIFSLNKGITCLNNDIDIMIDDHMDFLRDIKKNSPETARFMMHTEDNAKYSFPHRICTWPEFLQWVEKIDKHKKNKIMKSQFEFSEK